MHQLTVFEMEEISGGALTDTLTDIVTWAAKEVGAIALGASLGAIFGTAYAGRWGGVSGGIFGIGSIGQGVGMIAGVILGGVCWYCSGYRWLGYDSGLCSGRNGCYL